MGSRIYGKVRSLEVEEEEAELRPCPTGLRGATRGYTGLLRDEGTIRAGFKSMARHCPRRESYYISECPGHPFLLQLLYLHPQNYCH